MLKRPFTEKSAPLALLISCLVAFGLLINTLGFYWDDWPMMWFAHTLGPLGFPSVFAGDRPFLSWIYVVTTSILNTTPLPWQILGLITRWLTALAVWWSMRQLWPEKPERALWIGLLIAIFPGFKEQPISVVFANGLLLLAPYFASLGLMLLAIRKPSRFWLYTILGLAGYFFCTFSTEYYVGLDLVRPVLIWLVVSETEPVLRQRFWKTLRYWLPYLVLMIIFLIWRVFIFKFPTYQPVAIEGLSKNPLGVIVGLISRIPVDMFKTGWLAWIEPFRFPRAEDFASSSSILFWVVVVASFFLVWLYLKNHQPDKEVGEENPSNTWAKQSTLVGLFVLFIAGFPYWVTGLPVELSYYYDRFTLAFMLGSALFILGVLDWVIHTRKQKVILLSLMMAMAIGGQFENANTYRREWNIQKDFFWQLTWRAPAMKPGTYLITESMPLAYYSDNSLTAPLNWTYAPDNRSLELPYYLGFFQNRLGKHLDKIDDNQAIHEVYRNASFRSSLASGLVYFYSPPGCLRIIDPNRDNGIPTLSHDMIDSIHLSHPGQIITSPAQNAHPPLDIFGSEPVHTWCYYFEKADLAAQLGNWQEVTRLGNEAAKNKLEPVEQSEKVVFLEAQFYTGDVRQALTQSAQLHIDHKELHQNICDMLTRVNKTFGKGTDEKGRITAYKSLLDCPKIK